MLIGWYGKSIRKLQSTQRKTKRRSLGAKDEGIAAITRDAPPRSGLPRRGGRRRNSNSQEGITQERDCNGLGLSQSSEPRVQDEDLSSLLRKDYPVRHRRCLKEVAALFYLGGKSVWKSRKVSSTLSVAKPLS